jgi:hypothetical protein
MPTTENSICCRTYHPTGCDGRLVCHAAPVEAARRILRDGRILSKHRLTGASAEQLAHEGGWGDPGDYFDHVCLSRGNCVTPDIVAMTRQRGRNLSPREADEDFYPGVRFFFRTAEMFRHPSAVWDGIHPVKIQDCLELAHLHAVVAPANLPDGKALALELPSSLVGRFVILDHRQFNGLAAWSDAAFGAAMNL